MPKKNLTDRAVKALKTEKTLEDFWDTKLEGFGCRVYRSGTRSFFVRYRANGTQRRKFLGRYDRISLADARDQAKATLGKVAVGRDPAQEEEEAERDSYTFGELADAYLRRHARQKKRPRSVAEDERQLEHDLRPAWSKRPVSAITRADVIALLDGIVDRGSPVMANRTRALVNKIFNFGLEEDLIDANPAHKVKPRAKESPRDRFLSEAEIKLLWQRIPAYTSPTVGAVLRISLLTGQRLGNVMRMREAEIDGDLWTIRGESFKGKRPHVVPLAPQALAVIGASKAKDGWVFPGRSGGPIKSYKAGTDKLREKVELNDDWKPHDLRHTVSTHMARLGVSRFLRDRILGHTDRSIGATYDQYEYLGEKREALEAWGTKLEEIVS